MSNIRPFHLVGVRADGGNTKGSAINTTVTLRACESLYLVPKGGDILIRLADEAAAENVTWPEELPITSEGLIEALGNNPLLPAMTLTLGAGESVTGWVIGAPPEIA